GDLEQKQPAPDVAILEGLGAERLLQRVELNQLQGQCAAQKLIAIKLDWMPVQGRIHLIDRAAMISGDLCHTFVDDLVAVHDASLPLPARFANTTSVARVEPTDRGMIDVSRAAVPCHSPRYRASGFVLCRVTPRPRFRKGPFQPGPAEPWQSRRRRSQPSC